MVRSPALVWPLALACLVSAASAAAQTVATPPRAADPLNAQAAVPALRYESAFASYRSHTDLTPIGWREANDTVTRIGGWRAYAREAAPPAAPAAKARP